MTIVTENLTASNHWELNCSVQLKLLRWKQCCTWLGRMK